jgi:hypothetical protein
MVAGAATTFNHYGFVKASYMMTDGIAAGSEHKPFFAINDAATTDLQDAQKSYISSTESRWGMTANNGSKTSAKFEFDLDAGQTNGAASMSNARVRQANISYKVSENGTITFGKKWTKFMGVLPATVGFTRVNFFAGNTGFLVDGFDYTHKMGMTDIALELANLPNSDATGTDNRDISLVSSPITTLAVNHKMGDHKIGLAHTMATLTREDVGTGYEDAAASGTKLYWAGKYNDLHVNLEYTAGSNLGNIQTGALAKAGTTSDEDLKSTAYFLSLKYAQPEWSVYGGYGTDAYTDEEEAGDAGKSGNTMMTLGFDKKLDDGLVFFIEHNAFTTAYYSAADDESEDSNGALTELGMIYKF